MPTAEGKITTARLRLEDRIIVTDLGNGKAAVSATKVKDATPVEVVGIVQKPAGTRYKVEGLGGHKYTRYHRRSFFTLTVRTPDGRDLTIPYSPPSQTYWLAPK